MPASTGDLKRMNNDLDKAAGILRQSSNVLIITHIDADGISAGAIAYSTSQRLGLDVRIQFEKKITDETIDMINRSTEDAVWICDLGSGYLSSFTRSNIIVTDHHVPDPKWRRKQTILDDFDAIHNLNPHGYGMDGSFEMCGAGMTYLLSRTVDPSNTDLAYLAIIGAVGDFQDSNESRLVGLNRMVLEDAVNNGDVVIEDDLRLFGRETRPLVQFLQFSTDTPIPGITDDSIGCSRFFDAMGISLKEKGEWKVWNDLDQREKDRVIDRILDLLDPSVHGRIYGEMYTFPNMPRGNGLRDAKEYATVLNSCGRYDDAETGLRICMGDLDALKVAESNRAEHRRHISSALSYVKENHLVRERRFIQYFDAGSEIRETVVGIVAGMLLNSSECRANLPIIAFVDAEDGIKVSARANRHLVDNGLNLAEVMKTAASIVGGLGGGHSVAAGATIPPESKEQFLEIVEDLVSSQVV